MSRRLPRRLLAAVLVGGGLATVGLWAAARRVPGPAVANSLPAVRTATVVRTDVAARHLESGTLGYAGDWRLTNPGPSGVLTAVAAPASVVARGQSPYELDGHPIRLLYGDRLVWRDLASGMTDGPDVGQLETNLAALGYGASLVVDDHFTDATAGAIRRWQAALGAIRTGRLALGEVLFAPGPARVARTLVTPGARVEAGQPVVAATSTIRVVTVNLPTIEQAAVAAGAKVSVTPPGGRPLPATVTAVGRVAEAPAEGTGAVAGQPATIAVTITLDQPDAVTGLDQAPVQVAITTSEHKAVLAVPVTALVAATDGGYLVVADEGGARRRIAVTPGIFDELTGLVEVSGGGLAAGLRVEVPAA